MCAACMCQRSRLACWFGGACSRLRTDSCEVRHLPFLMVQCMGLFVCRFLLVRNSIFDVICCSESCAFLWCSTYMFACRRVYVAPAPREMNAFPMRPAVAARARIDEQSNGSDVCINFNGWYVRTRRVCTRAYIYIFIYIYTYIFCKRRP